MNANQGLLTGLPDEIIIHVSSWLEPRAICRLSTCNQHLYRICKSDIVWKLCALHTFGSFVVNSPAISSQSEFILAHSWRKTLPRSDADLAGTCCFMNTKPLLPKDAKPMLSSYKAPKVGGIIASCPRNGQLLLLYHSRLDVVDAATGTLVGSVSFPLGMQLDLLVSVSHKQAVAVIIGFVDTGGAEFDTTIIAFRFPTRPEASGKPVRWTIDEAKIWTAPQHSASALRDDDDGYGEEYVPREEQPEVFDEAQEEERYKIPFYFPSTDTVSEALIIEGIGESFPDCIVVSTFGGRLFMYDLMTGMSLRTPLRIPTASFGTMAVVDGQAAVFCDSTVAHIDLLEWKVLHTIQLNGSFYSCSIGNGIIVVPTEEKLELDSSDDEEDQDQDQEEDDFQPMVTRNISVYSCYKGEASASTSIQPYTMIWGTDQLLKDSQQPLTPLNRPKILHVAVCFPKDLLVCAHTADICARSLRDGSVLWSTRE